MVIDQTPPSQAVDTLRSALDEVEIGVVLLDQDLVPQFINRCFMGMWHLNNPAELEKLDRRGLSDVRILPGAVGPDARAIGGAALPLIKNFARDRDVLFKEAAGEA